MIKEEKESSKDRIMQPKVKLQEYPVIINESYFQETTTGLTFESSTNQDSLISQTTKHYQTSGQDLSTNESFMAI